ncbi:MAG: sel1 repeat family protein [Proteobacteria bacterium]|nr:sel1 repeat family protein [Pseudomonadota bacterium]
MFLTLVTGCSHKKETSDTPLANQESVAAVENAENVAENKVTSDVTDAAKAAAVAENQAESETVAVKPLRKPLAFRPVSIEMIQKLDYEKLEADVMASFASTSDAVKNEELKPLKERADKGDDSAKESFVSIVYKRPHTDPMYRVAIGYLMSIRDFKDPDVMMARGLMEYSNAAFNPHAKENAKQFFKMAAELNHEKTLEYLVKNPSFDMSEMALERLAKMYEPKIVKQEPKAMYDWAKLLEMGPASSMAKSQELLKRSAELGYARAQFTLGVSLLGENGGLQNGKPDWDKGYELLKKAAANGSEEAWLFLANLYAIVTFSDTLQEANEMGVVTMTQAQFDQIKADLAAQGEPKMVIVETAHKAGGYDEACGMLLAIGANEDSAESTLKARDYAIECIDRFIDAIPSRDACDRAYDQATYAQVEEFDYEKNYSLNQRSHISQSILNCYLLALEDGADYAQDEPYVGFATALQLATIYTGNSRLTIAPDPAKAFSYVFYAASHNDITGQVILGNYYKSGTYVTKNEPRACFWYQQAAASHLCNDFCKDEGNAKSGTCQACVEAAGAVAECRKKAGK